ncbi:MAG TPA: hypothetical protein VMF06_01665 [Candidatus Limnocylindria bacterium]|nr:hypothetical protein [Candidatus Limnocylindria bacterium]
MKAAFVRTVLWRVVATLASTVSAFIVIKLYDKYFDQVGLFAVINTAQQVLGQMPVLDGGFRLATNRALLAQQDSTERMGLLRFAQTLTWLSGLAGAVAGLAAMALYSFSHNAVASGVGMPFLLSLGVIGGGALTCIAQVQMLTGLGLQRRVFSLNALNSVVFLVTVWLGLRAHMGAWTFPLALAVSQILNGVAALAMAKAAVPELRPFEVRIDAEFKRFFRQYAQDAWAAFRMQIVIIILYTSDLLVLSAVSEGRAADVYALLARLFTVMRQALQSADESLWPAIAARSEKATEVSGMLLRLNGWLYGAVMGAAAVTLPSFIASYTPEKGVPEAGLAALFAARYLITGLATQPSYFLYGKGRFDLILRYQWREFALAMLLAIPLGMKFGPRGIATGFLVATVAGTFWSFPKSYADGVGRPVGEIFGGMWLRAILASVVSVGAALAVLRWGHAWPIAVLAGGWGVVAAMLWAVGWAWWRTGMRSSFPGVAKLAAHL